MQGVESTPRWWLWPCSGDASLLPLCCPLRWGETVNPAFCSSQGPAVPLMLRLFLSPHGPEAPLPPPQAQCAVEGPPWGFRLWSSVLLQTLSWTLVILSCHLWTPEAWVNFRISFLWNGFREWGHGDQSPLTPGTLQVLHSASELKTHGFCSWSRITFSSPFLLQSWRLLSSVLSSFIRFYPPPGWVYSTNLSNLRVPGLPHVPDTFGKSPSTSGHHSRLHSCFPLEGVYSAGIWIWQRNKVLFSFSLLLFAEASIESSLCLSMASTGLPTESPAPSCGCTILTFLTHMPQVCTSPLWLLEGHALRLY